MEDIDVRTVIKKLLRRWYLFVLSLFITMGLAAAYLALTPKTYLVESTILLKDQSVTESGVEEKLLSGFELLEPNAEVEDEINILTSYSTISQSLKELNFEVSYFAYPSFLGTAGKVMAEEVYPAPFNVNLDTAGWQILDIPIFISFPDDKHYRVQVSGEDEEISLYSLNFRKTLNEELVVSLDTVIAIGQPLATTFLSLALDDVGPDVLEDNKSYYISISSIENLTENYQQKLSKAARVSKKSNIVRLSLAGANPEKEITFLNTLGEVYINNSLQQKNRLGERTISFIDSQLQGVTDSLRHAENRLQTFRANSQVIDIGVTAQNITKVLNELEELQAQLVVQNEYYNFMSDYLKNNDEVMDIVAPSSVGIQDNLLNSLLLQLSQLNAEKISKDFSSRQSNPVMQVLENKIKSTKQALAHNIANLIRSNNIALKGNSDRIKEIKRHADRLPKNERDLIDIQRQFTLNDNIYNFLLRRRAETGIAVASNVPDKKVIDYARQIGHKPIHPNSMYIMMVAFIFGLVLPTGFIFVKDYFQPQVLSVEQLYGWTDIPILDQIAQVNMKDTKKNYIGESYLAHSFRYIRQHINILQQKNDVKVIGVTSAKSGEGKTFCALNVAKSFSQSDQRTLLIDADLHHPSMSQSLGLSHEPGLTDYLVYGESPSFFDIGTLGLKVLPAGRFHDNPSDLLMSQRMSSLIASLREQYDIIIFDTPPVGTIADYLMLNKYIDYSLLVIRNGFSGREEIKRLDKLTKQYQMNAGIIYNGTSMSGLYKGYYRHISS